MKNLIITKTIILILAILMAAAFSSCKKEAPLSPTSVSYVKSYSTNMSGSLYLNGTQIVMPTNVGLTTNTSPYSANTPSTFKFEAFSQGGYVNAYCAVTINKNSVDTVINLSMTCDTVKYKGIPTGEYNYTGVSNF